MTQEAYSEQIQKLLDSLVGALSTAIDARTPHNANHTRNMAQYAARFLDWLEETGNPWRFAPDRRRAFLLAVWLHDVGKLVVPLAVMDKQSRLGPALNEVEHCFSDMELLDHIAVLEGRLTEDQSRERQQQRQTGLDLIYELNCADKLSREDQEAVRHLARQTYRDQNGEIVALFADSRAWEGLLPGENSPE